MSAIRIPGRIPPNSIYNNVDKHSKRRQGEAISVYDYITEKKESQEEFENVKRIRRNLQNRENKVTIILNVNKL